MPISRSQRSFRAPSPRKAGPCKAGPCKAGWLIWIVSTLCACGRVPLEPGKEIERPFSAGQSHEIVLPLAEGEAAHLRLDQLGIDVEIRIDAPGAPGLRETDSPTTPRGPESITVIANRAGDYRLRITPVETDPRPGRYRLVYLHRGPARAEDHRRSQGEVLYSEAGRLHWEGTEEALQRALELYSQVVEIFTATSGPRERAWAMLNLAEVKSTLGDPYNGLQLFDQTLDLFRASGDRAGEAETLADMGSIYLSLSDHSLALELLRRAGDIKAEIGDSWGRATTLHNLGGIYHQLGEERTALTYYERALEAAQKGGHRYAQAYILTNIGHLWQTLGDSNAAEQALLQGLELHRAENNLNGELQALTTLGTTHAQKGDTLRARKVLEEAHELVETIGTLRAMSIALLQIGRAYEDLMESTPAEAHYRQVLEVSRAGMLHPQAAAHFGLSRLARRRGDLDTARQEIQRALEIIEALRGRQTSQKLRASLLAAVRDYYEHAIDLEMELDRIRPGTGHRARALRLSEQARARSLLEILREARADLRRGVDTDLVALEEKLQADLNTLATRQLDLDEGSDDEALRRQLDDLLVALLEVRGRIRSESPWYAALTQPEPLEVEEIQGRVLDADTLLLEYSLGEERSHLWAVTPDEIRSFELPPRAEVEAAALRFYDLLTARNRQIRFETAGERAARLREASRDLPEAGRELSRMVIGPLEGSFDQRRLAVVADGALQVIPFAALPLPRAAPTGEPVPLVARHELVYLPSASVLGTLRQDLADRPPAPKTLAVLADPVYSRDDPRLRATATEGPTASPARSSAQLRFPRLPYTHVEAEEILRQVPPEQAFRALGLEASRRAATGPHLRAYRIIHFATHALANNEHPELSGIVLSLVDEAGRPQDGFLRLHDIYNLRLEADLVVLSACRTAIGREVRGEGLMGLTRGFMHAGAPRVVASLWDVDDAATAELMGRFYRHLLGQGLPAAAALREAQLSMWRDPTRADPFEWAGFVVQGEWR